MTWASSSVVERYIRIVEVRGSSPLWSTITVSTHSNLMINKFWSVAIAKKYIPSYKTEDELMDGAVKSTLFKKMNRNRLQKKEHLELSDSDVAKELEDWSLSANKIVGYEGKPTHSWLSQSSACQRII